VLGITPGETRSFPLTYPDDYHDEDARGQKATFTVLAKEVREKQLPELTDDLAKKLTEGRTETLDALKAEIRGDMTKRLDRASENAVERDIIDKVVADSSVSFPQVLVEAEVDDDRKDLVARLAEDGRTLDDYLRSQEKTQEQLDQELVDAATKRVGSSLVLGEIARAEHLELTDADVDAYIEFLASEQNTTSAAVRAFVETRGSMGAVRNRAQTRKVIDYLKGAAAITTTEHTIREAQAPDTDAPPVEKGKRTKKKAESK